MHTWAPGSQADWQSPSSVVQYWSTGHCSDERHRCPVDIEELEENEEREELKDRREELELTQAFFVQAIPPAVHVQVLQPSGPIKLSPGFLLSQIVPSRRQRLEHPSPFILFPSSHASRLSTLPLPHQCVRKSPTVSVPCGVRSGAMIEKPNPVLTAAAIVVPAATKEIPAIAIMGMRNLRWLVLSIQNGENISVDAEYPLPLRGAGTMPYRLLRFVQSSFSSPGYFQCVLEEEG